MLCLFLIAVFVASMAFLLYGVITLDRLIQAEYEKHRNLWEADGKPYFRGCRDSSFFSGISARSRLASLWRIHTPEWILESPFLIRALCRYRWCMRFAFIAMLAYGILLFLVVVL